MTFGKASIRRAGEGVTPRRRARRSRTPGGCSQVATPSNAYARQAKPVSRSEDQADPRRHRPRTYLSFLGPRLIQGPAEPKLEPGDDDGFAPPLVEPERVEATAGDTLDAVPVTTGQRPGRIGVLPQ